MVRLNGDFMGEEPCFPAEYLQSFESEFVCSNFGAIDLSTLSVRERTSEHPIFNWYDVLVSTEGCKMSQIWAGSAWIILRCVARLIVSCTVWVPVLTDFAK